ncbi:MAG: sulfite exporter TauE/SafE family protein, partial [bacterium]
MLILLFPIVLFIAGLFGMMGLAGGVIYVPLLSWWGLDFATGAIPLSLLLGTATGLSASYTYMRGRFIHFRVG